jgi:hypothetical protein
MISKQVAVFETEKEVKNLQTQLDGMKSKEIQKNFELEQSVDFKTQKKPNFLNANIGCVQLFCVKPVCFVPFVKLVNLLVDFYSFCAKNNESGTQTGAGFLN